MKNQKNLYKQLYFIVIVTVLIFGAGSYFGFRNHEYYKKEKVVQSEIVEKQKEADKEIQQMKDQEVKDLKKEVESLKNQKSQTIIKEITTPSSQTATKEPSNMPDLVSIIKEWKPYVAYVECAWNYTDGTEYRRVSGSGFLLKYSYNKTISVMTNRHVVVDGNGYGANTCWVKFPNTKNTLTINGNAIRIAGDRVDINGNVIKEEKLDLAWLDIQKVDDYINGLSFIDGKYCVGGTGQMGDSLVVLGYPAIGSQTDVTATEGIISGVDGNFYITSAKIDHGNSGGIAILLRNDCYLGVPTFATVGSIESLGRILYIF